MNEQQIQEATTRREQQEAALLRPDGTKLYGEQEDKERRSAIRRSFEAEMERVIAGIEERAEQASRELESLEHADPAGGLSTEERQRAAAMNAFVGAEVDGLSTPRTSPGTRSGASRASGGSASRRTC